MNAASVIPTSHRAATLRTVIGLLAVTGMRVGEAIRLDLGDIDHDHAVLMIRDTKFGKSRELAVEQTTIRAVREYLDRRDRPVPADPTAAVFTSAAGTRLTYGNVHLAFKRIVAHAGLRPRCPVCRPRPHDLRHSFAVNTLLDAYRDGTEIPAGWRSSAPISGTSILDRPTGICRPRRSCSRLAPIGSRTSNRVSDESARADAASVLYRPTDQPAKSQPAHDRRLPQHAADAARVRCPAHRQAAQPARD